MYNLVIIYVHKVYTVQLKFKADRTRVWHSLDTTCFLIYTCASICLHARVMMLNLSFRALVYVL